MQACCRIPCCSPLGATSHLACVDGIPSPCGAQPAWGIKKDNMIKHFFQCVEDSKFLVFAIYYSYLRYYEYFCSDCCYPCYNK